ncbi:MAG: tRNA(Met) cytidine acetyltransferase TmcA [Halobacteriaceae archaeon]
MLAALAASLRAEARAVDERRVLVLAGGRDAGYEGARTALRAAAVDADATTLVGRRDALDCERVRPTRADRLLGRTRDAVVLDCHDACRPNAVGQSVGAVDGGGLLLVLAPPLDDWPARRDGFDEGLAVPPYGLDDVTGRFRRRLVETLRAHDGVALVDVDADRVDADGLTDPAPRRPPPGPTTPTGASFPGAAYETCLTRDQSEAVAAFEALLDPPAAVVVTADRGRGKSSAAGLAAGALAARGLSVVVTAPGRQNAAEVFARARALLDRLRVLEGTDGDPVDRLDAGGGGSVRFERPTAAADAAATADAVFVDEAAALPVRVLDEVLAADRVAFTTTVRGYEGAGRGFDVRFRDHLDASDHAVTEARLSEPIRYAAGDPVETWLFHALCLDASPAAAQLVADATPATTTYRALDAEALAADENRLREVFGLLVAAHYRTEPDDLARLLDAPNLFVRALTHDGHVVSVALCAREGSLDADRRAAMYEGERVRGNMLPDVLTSQLRDEGAAAHRGVRVVRVATHHAARSRGLGSRLLEALTAEVGDDVAWVGAGFGATPDLVRFWAANGFSAVHLSTTRNETSGEYSALVLRPTGEAGRRLRDRHADWFAARAPAVLGSALRDCDPDVVRATLRACDATVTPDVDDRGWRLAAAAAFGPALSDVDPRPFRELARAHLVDPAAPDALSAREERLLVRRALQARPWDEVAAELDYHSTGQCMRAFGDACQPLVDAYGGEVARAEADRYR